ncbi:hypothetical protein TEA_021568 [Camellia sinensis var. sinensis]|uniref:Amino acid transporter transmembrane domain-containing protein n=1 Tax=Camellia sinensis var. sinensis TaxID=542762 RepID=A0A4V6RYQ3_CAMSN|nr:hypothetical protein TEA_021568 [Camellia sinensis var. sinensis]
MKKASQQAHTIPTSIGRASQIVDGAPIHEDSAGMEDEYFESGYEENQVPRDCENGDDNDNDNDESDTFIDSQLWPQSYRQSMDMYTNMAPPSASFLAGTTISTSFLTSPHQRPHGLLTTPYALKEGGWWSLTILIILGIITCYTGVLLKRCLESSPGLETYPDIGQAAFGVPGRVCLASSCVEYLIMMSDNLSALFSNAQINFNGIHLDSYQMCTIISTLFILPTVWLRNLSLLSYISVGGVFTAVLVSLCLLWVGVVDQVGFHPIGLPLNLAKLPVTIGLFGFCFGCHSIFPNIYSSMKKPSQFPSVLTISFVTSGVLYAAVAICGFLMFGNSTKSQFTLNMPPQFIASKVAAWTTVVAPVTKYALTITPVAFSLEELLPSAQSKSHGVSILIRTILVLSTLVVALAVPYFGSVMAFIGSLLVMLVISTCILIMVVGVICAIVGTYSAIISMVEERG